MTYQEAYDKLIKHAAEVEKWKQRMVKSHPDDKQTTDIMAKIRKDTMTNIQELKQNEELSRFVEEIEETNNRF